jgi:1,2-diacylglycerol 3-beta-galactosyltransferase
MKRVLILMSKTGGGHLASAQAIQATFAAQYGDEVEATIVDLLMDYLPWPMREAPKSYGWIANRTPWLWGTLYRAGHTSWLTDPIIGATVRLSATSIMEMFVHYRPDLIVSVHPLVQELALHALERLRANIPYAIVVTDLATIHPLWFDPEATRCFVASETAFQAGLKAGMTADQLRLFGLPVRPIFAQPTRPRLELRNELGMDPNLPAVLLVGGGDGIGRVAVIARAIGKRLGTRGVPAGQMVIVCGRNRRLQTTLSNEQWRIPVQVHGFVSNMSDWMAACDCIVTKAGPGTIAESLIRGLPILLSGYIPGQEEGNVPYVVENEVGVFASEPAEIASQIARWFGPDRAELQRMAENAKRLANPHSTENIVAELASLIDL